MKKAIRRHQQKVAKTRRFNIYQTHSWQGRYGWWIDRHWKSWGRMLMQEPGDWEHEMMIQPARARTHQSLRLVKKGIEPDLLEWPDFKKPVIWYW